MNRVPSPIGDLRSIGPGMLAIAAVGSICMLALVVLAIMWLANAAGDLFA